MADIEVEETVVVSDVSEGSASGDDDDSVFGGGLLPEPIKGVRNCGVPPFVTNLYDLVSDKATNSTISWVISNTNHVSGGGSATSFVVWNEVDFVNNVFPLMSKSNKFDTFITQLNYYGFRKVSWDRREYANEWFQEGKPHLLKNITKRNNRTISDEEKLTSEMEKLERESNKLDNELHAFKAHVDTTISDQRKILHAIANAIKSTFDHHHSRLEVVNSNDATQSLTLAGQQSRETSELVDDPCLAPSCKIRKEEINKN
ncbi:hypothetical protein QVD17_21375 [Tagetes erecta]|uniref:HSF-type DNA-binding domain-containing protein n=1 Tax=Tagetes erecta TaxID=13708 RepID=A0AAD8KEX8_TARER|nr:hypothetical protein QVD17_21375 [Tagetes erecta]